MRLIFLDTETTGINKKRRNGESVCDGHRVVEIGCIEVVNRKFTGREFHTYLNPEQKIDSKAISIHGITDAFLVDKPRFNEVVHDFFKFIKNSTIIIHNATFDISFLDQEFSLLPVNQRPVGSFKYIDTLLLARSNFPGVKNDLNSLCERCQVEGRQGARHGALLDARLLALVYLKIF